MSLGDLKESVLKAKGLLSEAHLLNETVMDRFKADVERSLRVSEVAHNFGILLLANVAADKLPKGAMIIKREEVGSQESFDRAQRFQATEGPAIAVNPTCGILSAIFRRMDANLYSVFVSTHVHDHVEARAQADEGLAGLNLLDREILSRADRVDRYLSVLNVRAEADHIPPELSGLIGRIDQAITFAENHKTFLTQQLATLDRSNRNKGNDTDKLVEVYSKYMDPKHIHAMRRQLEGEYQMIVIQS